VVVCGGVVVCGSFLLLSVVGCGAKKKTAKSGLNFGR